MAMSVQEIKETKEAAERPATYNAEQLQLLKDTIAKGATDAEFNLFLEIVRAKRLNPFNGDVFLVKRWDAQLQREVATPQTGINGYRLIADRTDEYAPGRETTYEFDKDGRLVSATAYVKKWVRGEWHEISATAFYDEYKQTKKDGTPTSFWKRMPRLMLVKCAEALALRRAFPAELSGIYTHEEMGAEIVSPPETQASPPAFTSAVAGLITTEQKMRLKKITEALAEYDVSADALKRRMFEQFGAAKSADLTEQDAGKFIADLYDWQNSLEEARAANIEEAVEVAKGNKPVPF